MISTIKIPRRGQITTPKSLRDSLGITEGNKYGFQALEGGILVLTPQGGKANAARKQLREALVNKGASLDDMLGEMRKRREASDEA